MRLNTEFNRKIKNAEEIGVLLQFAFLQCWEFSCLHMLDGKFTAKEASVLDVNLQDQSFVVDSDALKVSSVDEEIVAFRAQSGGLSLVFKTSIKKQNSDPSACEYKYQFPDSLRFNQLRRAVRVNLMDHPRMQVSLFANGGERFDGRIIDLSASGVKIQMIGNICNKISSMEVIEDCRLVLPAEQLLTISSQVRGLFYDSESGTSFIRCQFLKTDEEDTAMLQKLINTSLFYRETGGIKVAI